MLAMRLRVRPCSARCSPRSVGRVTTIWSSSCFTVMSGLTRSSSSPLGPLTFTRPRLASTSTPSGTGIGCFPIRLTGSPHPRDELPAHAGAPGVVAGHYSARGGDDGRAHAAQDLGDIIGVHVLAPAGLGDALEAAYYRVPVLGVLEAHTQDLAHPGRLDGVVLDVALLAQDPRQLGLELGCGHHDVVLIGDQAVADAGQEVCDRVGLHSSTSSTWSAPGCSPRAPPRAGRCGKARTCAGTPAGARTACSGCSCASCTSLCATDGLSVTSWPFTPLRSSLRRRRSPRRRPLRPPRLPRPAEASRRPRGSLP